MLRCSCKHAFIADDVEVCRVRQMIAFYHLREGLHVPFENVNDVLLYDLAYLCAETRDVCTIPMNML